MQWHQAAYVIVSFVLYCHHVLDQRGGFPSRKGNQLLDLYYCSIKFSQRLNVGCRPRKLLWCIEIEKPAFNDDQKVSSIEKTNMKFLKSLDEISSTSPIVISYNFQQVNHRPLALIYCHILIETHCTIAFWVKPTLHMPYGSRFQFMYWISKFWNQ